MNISKLFALVFVTLLIAILLASALTNYELPLNGIAFADQTTSKGGVTPPQPNAPTIATKNYLPIIFLNSATAGGAWLLAGNAGTNWTNDFIGTTDNMTFTIRVSNTIAFRIVPGGDTSSGFAPNIIGGSYGNTMGPGVYGATIAGGGQGIYANVITGNGRYSTIAGGVLNTASNQSIAIGGGFGNSATAEYSVIGGGYSNTIQNFVSTISGGTNNLATATYTTIGGGSHNTAGGNYATIPGGDSNVAFTSTLAAGHRAKAYNTGTFVWADSTDTDFASTANNQFLIRANGGVGINTTTPNSTLTVNGATTITGTTIISGNLGVKVLAPSATLDVAGTMRLSGGTTFARIQAGTTNLGSGTGGVTNLFTVTFPIAFATTPHIVATAHNDYPSWDVDDTFVVTVRRVSVSAFVVNVFRVDSTAGWSQNLKLDWYAWE